MQSIVIASLIFLSSCADFVKKSDDESYATVDVMDQEYESKVEIDSNKTGPLNMYGPTPSDNLEVKTQDNKVQSKVLGITFLPAGYLSIGYIGVLKKLEEKKVKPNILVCPELASLICLLYAKYKDLNRVEWEIYNFYSKLKYEKFYSTRWRELILELVEKEFKSQRLETLPVIVGLPIKISASKVKVYSKGVISELMEGNLKIVGDYPLSVVTEKFINYSKYFNNRGADKIYNIALVPNGKILNSTDGYLMGVYSKLVYSTKSRLKDQNTMIPLDKPLDSEEDILGLTNLVFGLAEPLGEEIYKSLL